MQLNGEDVNNILIGGGLKGSEKGLRVVISKFAQDMDAQKKETNERLQKLTDQLKANEEKLQIDASHKVTAMNKKLDELLMKIADIDS